MSIKQDDFIAQLNELDFSDSSKQLEALKHFIFHADESNQAKIHFIKEELLAGKYQIHPTHIAEKMLEHVSVTEHETEIA